MNATHPGAYELVPLIQRVNYQWSAGDGTIHRASTVVTGRDKEHLRRSLRHFFTINSHVEPADFAEDDHD